MKICLVHNAYGKFSGEEAVVEYQKKLLEENGHFVCTFGRHSNEIPRIFLGNIRAFLTGIFNPFSRYSFKQFLLKESPDVIHIHNLYPLVSPSILPIAKKLGFPVVMTVHNYRLVCPNGLLFTRGEICNKCEGGREYWCVIRNCERSYFKSLGYALRNWWSRKRRYYMDNVDIFASLTHFQRNMLIRTGIEPEKIVVLPNMVDKPAETVETMVGEYIGFCGRLSHEKGIEILIEVAKKYKDLKFAAAGDFHTMGNLIEHLPVNFKLLGHCDAVKLREFYKNSRFIVLPTKCYEGFPMVLLEAMLMSKAVICSNIGGLSEIVDDGDTGLLFSPGNVDDLGEKINKLWNEPELCRKMGHAGRRKVFREYSKEKYYDQLRSIYHTVIGDR